MREAHQVDIARKRKGTVNEAVMENVLLQLHDTYRHRKGIQTSKDPMTNSAVKRMILKLEASSCLDNRPRGGRPSISANATRTVQEEMKVVAVAGLSTHGEVSAGEVARRTDIPTVCVTL